MALTICGQQNRAAMRRRVAHTPGWCIACSDWKTASLCWMGTSGRNTPDETSPSSVLSPTAWVVICSVVEFIISATSGQVRFAAAIAKKSTSCASATAAKMGCSCVASHSSGQSSAARAGEGRWLSGSSFGAAGGGRLKASATTFSWPGVCLMSDVNSTMKESCLCWRADHGGVVQNRDVMRGLWSVSRRNCHPSSKNLKCLTAESGQQLSVEGGVPGACPRQLLGVECQWLPPPAVQLLKYAADVCIRGVCCEREHGVQGWVCQWYRGRQRPLQRLGGSLERVCELRYLEETICKNSPYLKTAVIVSLPEGGGGNH
jgi:hypothetical protein